MEFMILPPRAGDEKGIPSTLLASALPDRGALLIPKPTPKAELYLFLSLP